MFFLKKRGLMLFLAIFAASFFSIPSGMFKERGRVGLEKPKGFLRKQPVYDYQPMIILLKEHRLIEHDYRATYEAFMAARLKNMQRVEKALNALYVEKQRLQRFIQSKKQVYLESSSRKKIDAVNFYSRALTVAIADLKHIQKVLRRGHADEEERNLPWGGLKKMCFKLDDEQYLQLVAPGLFLL